MKKLTGAVALVLLTALALSAQDHLRTHTEPPVPPQAALDRLNLALGWRTYLPMDGLRDGFSSVLVLERQIVVQLRSGPVMAIDAETGRTQWRARFGSPYALAHPLGYNDESILAVNGTRLYLLDRKTGQVSSGFILPQAPSSDPVADEDLAYLSMGSDTLYAFELPKALPAPVVEAEAVGEAAPSAERRSALGVSGRAVTAVGPLSSGRQAGHSEVYGPELSLRWDFSPVARLERRPLMTAELLFLVGANGEIICLSKYDRRVFYRYLADAPASASAGQHGDMAYLPSRNFNLYAMHIPSGRTLWRFLAGGAIYARPAVTDTDIFVAPENSGLYRLDRAVGQQVWRNFEAQRFLAANPKFVYAADRSNRLMVLDRARGTQLAVYPGTRDFVFPIGNELTDRIYLASNDGLLVCLHDRDYPTPLRNKVVAERKTAPTKKEAKPEADTGDKAAPTPADQAEGKAPEK